MTTEEIKRTVTMRDVLARYGIEVKNNMCCCPIHKEKHPSMKVFKDGYKCFACGSGGDVFKFIQEMEGCDFKTAFINLGGTYEKHSNTQAKVIAKTTIKRMKDQKEKVKSTEKEFKQILQNCIDMCNYWIEHEEAYSDNWCYGQKHISWLWHIYEEKYIEGEEVNETDVFGIYREIKQRFFAV